jgi:hypothetical protein
MTGAVPTGPFSSQRTPGATGRTGAPTGTSDGRPAYLARYRITPSVSLVSARPSRRKSSRWARVSDVAASTWKRSFGLMAKRCGAAFG